MSSEIEMRGAQTEDQFYEKFASNQGLGDFTKTDWNLTGEETKVNRRGMTDLECNITGEEAADGQ